MARKVIFLRHKSTNQQLALFTIREDGSKAQLAHQFGEYPVCSYFDYVMQGVNNIRAEDFEICERLEMMGEPNQ